MRSGKYFSCISPSLFGRAGVGLLLCAFCASVVNIAFPQSSKSWEKLGNKALQDKDCSNATVYFKNALDKDAENVELVFKYAEALRQCNMYAEAEIYYQIAYSKDQGKEFPDGLFWLATMQKYNEKYEEAQINFTVYGKLTKEKSSFFAKKAKQEIKSCEYARNLIKDTISVKIENLGEKLNSTKAEFSPLLMNDSTLLFSSLREIPADNEKNEESIKIYRAMRNGPEWETIEMIDTSINIIDVYSANGSFSPDKTRFYFSVCSPGMICNIYVSFYKDGKWEHARKLEEEINPTDYTTTQPMSAMVDGKEILFFVSNRPQGKGGLDIWYCYVEQDGKKYSSPKKLDAKINSPGDEICPFYDSKFQTFYFSSNWHYGLGGYDIFKSKGGLKSFASPDNLGFPVNTSVNDFYYTVSDTTALNGFLVSNRKGSYSLEGETCCNDIYSFEFPKPEEKDSISKNPYKSLEDLNKYLPVTLYFHNDEPNPKSKDTITKLDYMTTYENYFVMKQMYQIEYSNGLEGDKYLRAHEDIEDFFSNKVEKGVDDLNFFMDLLTKELEKGRKIELGIKGYASPLAKSDYNVNLTLRRISSLINYMNNYENGMLRPYLNHTAENGGGIFIKKIPYGEYKSDSTVSDNLNDQKNSIYNRKAALERKIEILSVGNAETVKDSLIKSEETFYDFGKVKMGKKYSHSFFITNTSTVDMKIEKVIPSCDCTATDWTKNSIAPGKQAKMDITFDAEGKEGKHYKEITIFTNISSEARILRFEADISK
jgi:hypothetical protein